MGQTSTSETLTVTVSADRLFAVLADPTTHAAIDGRSRVADGTGRVVEAVDRTRLTEVGQLFRMGMNHPDHPDGEYQTVNKVHVLDPPRAIGWLTGYDPDGNGQLQFGGWFWRYDLVPVGPSRTAVTLTYDWAAVPQSVHQYLQFPPMGPNASPTRCIIWPSWPRHSRLPQGQGHRHRGLSWPRTLAFHTGRRISPTPLPR